MSQAIIFGANSGIYQQIRPLMQADGWKVAEVTRSGPALTTLPQWDLVLVMIGQIKPVGMWWETNPDDWEECFSSNLFTPMRLLRRIWKRRNGGCSVVFMAGSNPNMIMSGYSAYNVSKMALLKAVEQLDYETGDCKFLALGPGIVLTKIHEQTGKWPNPKLAQARAEGRNTPPERIWESIKWAVAQPKQVIGGRNLCASDGWGDAMRGELARDSSLLKLRRKERSL